MAPERTIYLIEGGGELLYVATDVDLARELWLARETLGASIPQLKRVSVVHNYHGLPDLEIAQASNAELFEEAETTLLRTPLDGFYAPDAVQLLLPRLADRLEKRARYLIHASAVALPDGQALLLVGGPGSGKTLTALLAAQKGCRVVSFDKAIITAGENPLLLGGTTEAKVRPRAITRWLPALAPAHWRAEAEWSARASISHASLEHAGILFSDTSPHPIAACFVVLCSDQQDLLCWKAGRAQATRFYTMLVSEYVERLGMAAVSVRRGLASRRDDKRLRIEAGRALARNVPLWAVSGPPQKVVAAVLDSAARQDGRRQAQPQTEGQGRVLPAASVSVESAGLPVLENPLAPISLSRPEPQEWRHETLLRAALSAGGMALFTAHDGTVTTRRLESPSDFLHTASMLCQRARLSLPPSVTVDVPGIFASVDELLGRGVSIYEVRGHC